MVGRRLAKAIVILAGGLAVGAGLGEITYGGTVTVEDGDGKSPLAIR